MLHRYGVNCNCQLNGELIIDSNLVRAPDNGYQHLRVWRCFYHLSKLHIDFPTFGDWTCCKLNTGEYSMANVQHSPKRFKLSAPNCTHALHACLWSTSIAWQFEIDIWISSIWFLHVSCAITSAPSEAVATSHEGFAHPAGSPRHLACSRGWIENPFMHVCYSAFIYMRNFGLYFFG